MHDISDVEAEKKAQAHLQAVEGFNTAQLKHANTQEKIVLPAQEGVSLYIWVILFYFFVFDEFVLVLHFTFSIYPSPLFIILEFHHLLTM